MTEAAAVLVRIFLDCADPVAVTASWNTALGHVEQPPPGGSEVEGNEFCLQ